MSGFLSLLIIDWTMKKKGGGVATWNFTLTLEDLDFADNTAPMSSKLDDPRDGTF